MRRYDTRAGSVVLRPETKADDAFLFELFAGHAGRPLKAAGLDADAMRTLLTLQYRAQSGKHRASYPDAAYSIIESEGAPIGRLIEADEGECVYFADFAFLPERQAKGLGTALIEMIADEWGARGRAARVEVRSGNDHSLKLCANLGFERTTEDVMGYVELRRAPRAKAG
ncbi:MAG: GNAT family N-acetyltransferase [Alphaproteobacteria bacterium]|nr:GNAT family N-acetyltransferase [Alphaproteobacteria bacterium]